MEGPSLVIATEELSLFKKKKILHSNQEDFISQQLLRSKSWGKHLLLFFTHKTIRIHFLMFGSYRIDQPRENRTPKLELQIQEHTIYFYSCAIKEIDAKDLRIYDWSTDPMSKLFSLHKARSSLSTRAEAQVCDVLMDQTVFSGVGNIIKNEVLWILELHPETKLKTLTNSEDKRLVKVMREYCHQFYEWKKENVLKRNWKIFRKKICPVCSKAVTKKATGKLQRISHFCTRCQKK